MRQLKIEEAKDVIRAIFLANRKMVENGDRLPGCNYVGLRTPVTMIGASGIGKSELVQQLGDELDVPVIDLRLATQEPGDLIGIPRGSSNNTTMYLQPDWFPKENEPFGILHFDELNRAPIEVRQCIFQVLTEWKIHTHVLNPGWILVSSVNPDVGDYQVESLDPAMVRRMMWMKLKSEPEEWLQWAKKNQTGSDIVNFIALQPDMLGAQEEFQVQLKPRPSQWPKVDRLMNLVKPDLKLAIIEGLVGDEAALMFQKYTLGNLDKYYTGAEILDGYHQIREDVHKQPNDLYYATCRSLLAEIVNEVGEEEYLNLRDFLTDCNAEHLSMILKNMDDQELVKSLSEDPALDKRVDGIIRQIRKTE